MDNLTKVVLIVAVVILFAGAVYLFNAPVDVPGSAGGFMPSSLVSEEQATEILNAARVSDA